MNLHTLRERLDELAWDEQVNFELSERHSGESDTGEEDLQRKIRELAQHLSPAVLDALEGEEGYLTWVLRLSPHVPGDAYRKRAQRYVRHHDSQVRFWATQVLRSSSTRANIGPKRPHEGESGENDDERYNGC